MHFCGRMLDAKRLCYFLAATGLIFLQAFAATNTIEEEPIQEEGIFKRQLTVSLQPPSLSEDDIIVVTGLTGSQTTDTNSLNVEIDNNAAATAKWIQSNGTLTVILSEDYTATDENTKLILR